MAVLVLADHDNERLFPHTARVIAAALAMASEVDVLVAGRECTRVADEAAQLAGVRRVLLCEATHLAVRLAEPYAELIASLAADYGAIISSTSSEGKDVLPRAAALLDVMQVSDVVEIVEPTAFKRPIYAGSVVATVRSRDCKQVLTVRPSAFAAVGAQEPAEIVTVPATPDPQLSSFVGSTVRESGRPSLATARVIVAGGRGLGSAEEFNRLILPIAEKLGGAVAASRAAVDAGYAPNEYQVGQTGVTVAPDLYIACGISGAIQHLAGMRESRVIVAINKDRDAPIFGLADYGLVADLFAALPELEKQIQERGLSTKMTTP